MTEFESPVPSLRKQAGPQAESLADELLDELVPHEVDWRALVTSHPVLSLAAVATLGFWLGRSRGRAILAGLSGLAADTVNDSINELVGRDVL